MILTVFNMTETIFKSMVLKQQFLCKFSILLTWWNVNAVLSWLVSGARSNSSVRNDMTDAHKFADLRVLFTLKGVSQFCYF